MSKFCGNCGKALADNARVCGYCGVPVSVAVQTNPEVKHIPGLDPVKDQEKADKMNKIIKSGAMIIIAIIVVTIGINVISSFIGYKGVVRKVINAFEDYDMNTLYEYASSLNYLGDDDEYYEELFDDKVSAKLDYYEGQVGYDLKIDFEIIDSYNLDERKLNNFLDELEESGAYVGKIDKIRQVDLELHIKGKRSENTYRTDDLLLIKENGKWKVFYMGYTY